MNTTVIVNYRGYSIYFILHALTIITAFTWHQLIQDYINKYAIKGYLKIALIYALFITAISVILHSLLGKYAKPPSDSDEELLSN